MQIYKKRKKKSYRDDNNSFVNRHKSAIVALLVVIIVLGGIAAVHAVENRRQAKLEAYNSGQDETVTYYFDKTTEADGSAADADNAENASAEADDTVNSTSESSNSDSDDTQYPDLSQSEVSWNGKTYKRNSYIKPILMLGVDRQSDMHTAQEYGEAGQCDGVFLIAQDTAHNTVKLLMIPRDTMTEVMERDPADGVIKPYIDHLSLSYCFGDGMEISCENSRLAVQSLLRNLPIRDYMAVDMSVINTVNDAVGGVTVTIPTEGMEKADAAFVCGETVTLKGEQAERFVRYRDTGIDNSAIARMSQHRQYIEGFYKALRNCQSKDSQTVTGLYDLIRDYMITNMPKDVYMKTALDVLQSGDIGESNMLALPGYGTATDTFDEYYADKAGTVEVVLSMFYREG